MDRFDDGRSNPYRVTFRDGDGVRSIYKFSTAGAVSRIEAGSEKYKVSVVMRLYIYLFIYFIFCVRGCFAHFSRCRLVVFVTHSLNTQHRTPQGKGSRVLAHKVHGSRCICWFLVLLLLAHLRGWQVVVGMKCLRSCQWGQGGGGFLGCTLLL